MLIGVAAVVLGGFVIICAAPFTSPRLYKTGGGLFLVSGTAEGASPTAVYTYAAIGQDRSVCIQSNKHLLMKR